MFGTPINRAKGWGERKNKDSKRNRRDSKKSLRGFSTTQYELKEILLWNFEKEK